MKKIGIIMSLMLFLGGCAPFSGAWKEAGISAHYDGRQGTDYVFRVDYENTGMSNLRLGSKNGDFLKIQVLDEKKENEIVYSTVEKTTEGKRKERIIPPHSTSTFKVRIDEKDLKPGVYNVDLLLEETPGKYTGVSLWDVKVN